MIQGRLVTWSNTPPPPSYTHLLLYAPDGQMEFFAKDNDIWETQWTYSTRTGVRYEYH